MIFKFFLQTNEYDFFIQRLRNAAISIDKQSNLTSSYNKGNEKARTNSQTGSFFERDKNNKYFNSSGVGDMMAPGSRTFDFENYVKNKYIIPSDQHSVFSDE